MEFHKDVMGIVTTEELYADFQELEIDREDNFSACDGESQLYCTEIPRVRKQSYKLLSDNYEKNELLYTIEHMMMPEWHQQEMGLDLQSGFS